MVCPQRGWQRTLQLVTNGVYFGRIHLILLIFLKKQLI